MTTARHKIAGQPGPRPCGRLGPCVSAPHYQLARRYRLHTDAQTLRLPAGGLLFAAADRRITAMQTDEFHVFDTTLRDGAQREGITYSVADKLAVARLLDQIGVGFIEGGWPGAMPKDTEFFARAAAGELTLRHAVLVAFGATRKAGVRVAGRRAGARAARLAGPGRHAGGEVRRPARRAGAAHHAGGEPRDGARHGGVPARARAAASSSTASTSSTATSTTPTTACASSTRRRRPGPTSGSSATPTAACSRWACTTS